MQLDLFIAPVATAPYITGIYGCKCHPFASWTESEFYHRRKFKVGQEVRRRCNGREGVIHRILPERGFYIVQYGALPRDLELEHAAELVPRSL